MSSQLDRIESMLRALCTHLGVQVSDRLGNGAAESLESEGGSRYTGVVSRFEHGWGFIECEAMNRNFFVHYSDIEGTGLRSLEAGEVVSFELAPGKDGRPKAVRVRRQASGRPAPRHPRLQGLPRIESDNGDPGMDDEDGMPEGVELPAPGRVPQENE
jgi:cold shock protein